MDRLRDYLDGELADHEREHGITPATRLTRADLVPVWRRSRELGFYGIHLPEEYGGQNLGYSQLAALKEEIGASGRVLAHSVLGDMGGPLRAGDILQHATAHQLDTYLLPLIRGERACCFSSRRPTPSSDVRSMRTVAVRDGDGYRLTGHKVFSSAGPFADFAIVVARMAGTGEKRARNRGSPPSSWTWTAPAAGSRTGRHRCPASTSRATSSWRTAMFPPPTSWARRATACASHSAGSPPTACCTARPCSAPPAAPSS
ncbi:acyl-CoA dehydrogenase family protein [Streptomyces nogalater]